jgi:hypothetical protein
MTTTAGTAVQWPARREPARVLITVGNPRDTQVGQAVERLSLDIAKGDYEFLKRYAAYLNLLADARGVVLRRKWTRKALAEDYLADACDDIRKQMADQLAELGPIPDGEDEAALAAYVAKVVDRDMRLASEVAPKSSK